MHTKNLYAELYTLLSSGNTLGVVSHYDAYGSIKKELVTSDEFAHNKDLAELLDNPSATSSGSLTTFCDTNGSISLLERFMTKPRLVILGGGHISLALAEIAHLTDFDTVVYDERPQFANAKRFPTASMVISDSYENLGAHLTFGPSDFVVNVTSGHQYDTLCLESVLAGPEPAYTGMIGSERKVAIVTNQLKEGGYDAERIERIHAPIGLKIGAQTPAEIALSIMAEVVSVKRKGSKNTRWLSGDLELIESVATKAFIPEAIITVLRTQGSVPTEVGCKLGVDSKGAIAGTIGGGASEAKAIEKGLEIAQKGAWCVYEVDLSDTAEDEGMVCGGTMQVLIEKA